MCSQLITFVSPNEKKKTKLIGKHDAKHVKKIYFLIIFRSCLLVNKY